MIRETLVRKANNPALQEAMGVRRARVSSHHGFDLGDDLHQFLIFRFADDILLFEKWAAEAATLVDSLVEKVAFVGLLLNAGKTAFSTDGA